jgi:quercetin dioxygenase-like cupin family protein
MTLFSRREAAIAIGAALGARTLAPGSAGAAEIDPKAVIYKLPDTIDWKGTGGNRNSVLAGDPTKPGLYVVINKWLAGNFSRPHFHPNDRFITVLKGTWWVGTGRKFDPANTVPMHEGTFVTHFGGQVHWDGAKDEDAIILIVGEGPATITRVEEEK